MRGRLVLTAFVLVAWSLAAGSAPAAESRTPSAHELASFQAFYAKRVAGGAAPVFTVSRDSATAPWRVAASVTGPGTRGLRTLCHAERTAFTLAKSWRAGESRAIVWLDRSGCAHPVNPVELQQRMPDTDVLALLERQAALLANARLVMAGNSACAVARSYPFALTALDVGAPGPSGEQMAALVYRGGIPGVDVALRVWMRRSGATFDLWTVSCLPVR